MRLFDVVGYQSDGAVYCPDHFQLPVDEGTDAPIFAGDEDVKDLTCTICSEPLVES